MSATHNKRNWRESKKDKSQSDNSQHYEVGWRLVEKMFYYYSRIKKAVRETKEEWSYIQGGKTGGGSTTHAFISDPTAMNGIKRATKLNVVIIDADTVSEDTIKNPEDWMLVVEKTLEHFSYEEDIVKVLKQRFFENRSMYYTCTDLDISKDRYYRCRDLGVRYARDCAIQLGLIKIF